MAKLELQPGIFVRHPYPWKWYSDPDTTSRDQLVPSIAYCGAYDICTSPFVRAVGIRHRYHRAENRGNPEIAELYRPLVEEYFSPQDSFNEQVALLSRKLGKWTGKILLATL